MSAHRFVLGVGLVLLCCFVFSTTAVSAPATVVKWGDSTPKTYSYWPAMQAFKAEAENKLPGKVDVQLFGDGVLGDQKTLLESTVMGAIQMCTVPSLVITNIVPELEVFSLPFVYPSGQVFSQFLKSTEGKRLGELFEKHGLKLIAWGYTGYTGLQNSKRDVKTPADLKGLKIRVLQNPLMVDTVNAMGGMAVAMGMSELYSALQQGVIDGIYTAPQLLHSMKIYEVAKFYAPLNVHQAAGISVMNLKFWNGLPADVKKVFMEAGETWTKVNEAYYLDSSRPTSDQHIMELFVKANVKVSDPDLEAFRKMTVPVVRKYRQQLGPEMVDRVLKAVKYNLD